MTTQATPIVILPTQLSDMIKEAGLNSATPNYHEMYNYILTPLAAQCRATKSIGLSKRGKLIIF